MDDKWPLEVCVHMPSYSFNFDRLYRYYTTAHTYAVIKFRILTYRGNPAPKAIDAFPVYFRFPLFQNIFQSLRKNFLFDLFSTKFRMTFLVIYSKFVTSRSFAEFIHFPYFNKKLIPPIFYIPPYIRSIDKFFCLICVFFCSQYFDRNAFMHHAIHVNTMKLRS